MHVVTSTLTTSRPEETIQLGAAWGSAAQAGWALFLSGDLGAGKTQLARGLAQGLGFPGRVHSPTFALINPYLGGRLPLYHLDLYRLQNREDVLGAGLNEYFHSDGVTLVEWGERWWGEDVMSLRIVPQRLAGPVRIVQMEVLDEFMRKIVYADFGA